MDEHLMLFITSIIFEEIRRSVVLVVGCCFEVVIGLHIVQDWLANDEHLQIFNFPGKNEDEFCRY